MQAHAVEDCKARHGGRWRGRSAFARMLRRHERSHRFTAERTVRTAAPGAGRALATSGARLSKGKVIADESHMPGHFVVKGASNRIVLLREPIVAGRAMRPCLLGHRFDE